VTETYSCTKKGSRTTDSLVIESRTTQFLKKKPRCYLPR